MSDFMKWLYANYITPQINAASQKIMRHTFR